MHLVQLLLPLVEERAIFDEVMHELTERDDIIVVEVMVEELEVRAHAIVSL